MQELITRAEEEELYRPKGLDTATELVWIKTLFCQESGQVTKELLEKAGQNNPTIHCSIYSR